MPLEVGPGLGWIPDEIDAVQPVDNIHEEDSLPVYTTSIRTAAPVTEASCVESTWGSSDTCREYHKRRNPLMTGAAVEGSWFDRTLEYNARLRGKELEKGESASRETVRLSPLPCWKHLAEEVYRARVAELVRKINESAAAARAGIAGRAAGGGWCPDAESGDSSQEDQEVTSAVLPCSAEEGPEGSVGSVRTVLRGVQGSRRETAGWRPGRGVPAGELPTPAAVRGGLRRRLAGLVDNRRSAGLLSADQLMGGGSVLAAISPGMRCARAI